MWLIDTHSHTLKPVLGENSQLYAILSHTWGNDEITFQDMQNLALASTREGFAKIQKSCDRAITDGYDYAWVDTCCINKESSAELSEAINSMYRWYNASAVCYAFLSDVDINADDVEKQIRSSVWFTRGWTLQELIAPQKLVFYDRNWTFLGTKESLSDLITSRTGVDEAILDAQEPFLSRSIAQRMSWAAERVTTRVEDIAYSLMGIFDVNMPLLYGEGERAFFRLQAEIIRQSDDHSIFAWEIHRERQPGLLADSPAAFKGCGEVKPVNRRRGHSAYSLTNRGLSLKLLATPFTTDTYLVRLHCNNKAYLKDSQTQNQHTTLAMFLRRLGDDDQYARVKCGMRTFEKLNAPDWAGHQTFRTVKNLTNVGPVEEIEINVRQEYSESNADYYKDRIHGFRIASKELRERISANLNPGLHQPHVRYSQEGNLSFTPRHGHVGVHVIVNQPGHNIKVIKLGFDFDYNPVCFIANTDELDDSMHCFPNSARAEDEQVHALDITEQASLHNLGWNEPIESSWRAFRAPPSLWALKGDRVNGLHAQFSPRGCEPAGVVTISREAFEDKLVWTVRLDDDVKTFPQQSNTGISKLWQKTSLFRSA